MLGDVDQLGPGTQEGGDGVGVAVVVLDRERTAWPQERDGVFDDGWDDRKAVRTCEDGHPGVACANLGRHRRGVRDVGRIADDEIDAAREVRKEFGGAHVGGVEHNAAAMGVDVAARPGQRLRIEFDGVHLGVGPQRGEGERERSRARAEVHHQRRPDARERRDAPLQQQLGLRPRGEHAGPDDDLDRA